MIYSEDVEFLEHYGVNGTKQTKNKVVTKKPPKDSQTRAPEKTFSDFLKVNKKSLDKNVTTI